MNNEPTLPPAIVFSDSAKRDPYTGKLTLAGVFQRLTSCHVPFKSPEFFVTVFMTNINEEIESLPMTMNIENAAGDVISSVTGRVKASAQVTRETVAEIAFPLPPTEFEAVGQYKAVMLVDGEPLGHRVFNVVLR